MVAGLHYFFFDGPEKLPALVSLSARRLVINKKWLPLSQQPFCYPHGIRQC
jgi:hypothetical protein